MILLLFGAGLRLTLLRQLAVQFRFGDLDKLGHEGLESTELGIWSGFRAGLHPELLYYQSPEPLLFKVEDDGIPNLVEHKYTDAAGNSK
jgi:hypothetical protein